ncbi:KIF3B [Symbiodinium sp. CCMP2592]|nr:KIF3B [Symbiodinium sp. CCMP2592]
MDTPRDASACTPRRGHKQARSMAINVLSLAGEAIARVSADPLSSVRELKQQIWALGGPEVRQLRLMLGTAQLQDEARLDQTGLADGSDIVALVVPEDETKNYMRTVVRCRPLRTEEEQEPGFDLDLDRGLVSVRLREFQCSDIFDESVSQAEVFERLGRDLTQHVLEGYNATVLCYGEGGAGKSYTLFGPSPDLVHAAAEQGLAPRAFRYVRDELRDLLAADPKCSLRVHEGQMMVEGGVDIAAASLKDLQRLYDHGLCRSCTNPRNGSVDSGSAFTILRLTIRSRSGSGHPCVRRLTLVDCASSHRRSKSEKDIEQMRNARYVGKNLGALHDVISALAPPSPHVPYRNSCVTRLLKESLGGNAKMVCIANLRRSASHTAETLCTLQFVSRVQHAENQPLSLSSHCPEESLLLEEATWISACQEKEGEGLGT